MSRIRLLATFHDLDEAHRAAEAVADAVPDAQVRAGDPDDARDALVAGQQAEMDQSAPTVPGGVVTGAQVRGSVLWGIPTLIVGCLLGLAVGLLVPVGGVSRFAVVVASTAAGGMALSTFGVLMGAPWRSEREGEAAPILAPDAVVDVSVDDRWRSQIDRALVRSGAVEVFHWSPPDGPLDQ
ncbi:MAG: hypothetical protein R2699_02240 [Acidimicrobiales bacterium]|nr:hypothetical protein [Acidimicrobiales bacterium]